MTKENANIDRIILRFLAGEATEAENEQIQRWVEESDGHMLHLMDMKNIMDGSQPAASREAIDTKKAFAKVDARIAADRRKAGFGRFMDSFMKAAAIMALPLAVSTIWMGVRLGQSNGEMTAMQEVTAQYGTRSKITLPDGSMAWLNSGSSIKYPAAFKGRERMVEMEGEVYFQVSADREHPFIVRTEQLDVRAVGTEFNVEAYRADSLIAVTLSKGAVDIESAQVPIASLTPDNRLVYNKNTRMHDISREDTFKWCSWRNGVLAFRNDPLELVFKRLGQIYNVDFVVDPAIAMDPYHATFKEEPLERIMSLLELTAPISYSALPSSGTDARRRILVKYTE